jgi:hypothetical protein
LHRSHQQEVLSFPAEGRYVRRQRLPSFKDTDFLGGEAVATCPAHRARFRDNKP